MAIAIWIWSAALLTNAIGFVGGILAILWIWRRGHSNRLQRIAIIVATTGLALTGLVNSFFSLLRLRGDP